MDSLRPPPAALLALTLVGALALAAPAASCAQADVDLAPLVDALAELGAQPGSLQAKLIQQQEWIHSLEGVSRNARLMLNEFANTQAELALRWDTIQQVAGSELYRLIVEGDLQAKLELERADQRQRMLELVLERARLRAKLAAMQANEIYWNKWHQLATFALFKRDHLRKLALDLGQIGAQSATLSASDYGRQHAAYERINELRPGKSSQELFAWIDAKLDAHFKCLAECPKLRLPNCSNAAPLSTRHLIEQWIRQ